MRVLGTLSLAAAAAVALTVAVSAQGAGQGPVATACKAEIAKYCAAMEHGKGDVRACLTAKKAEASPACKTALETTGPGQGKGQGKGKAN